MASYQQRGGTGSSSSSYQSPRLQLSEEEQATLIEDRIAQHTYQVQSVEALLVFAFVYIKEPKKTMNRNVYVDVDFQIPCEDATADTPRKSEYVSARLWGEEVAAVQQCRDYFVNDRGKPKPILISYTPAKLVANIGMNKQGQPQVYLKADRVCIFLDITNTLVVATRNESDGVVQEEETTTPSVPSPSSYAATNLDDTIF